MKTILMIASGDLRLAANQNCEPTQAAMEQKITAAIARFGGTVQRAHPYDDRKRHGFIDSQAYGMEVFRSIPPNAPLLVAVSAWQYSHHVLAGLTTHKGPILTVANWSGTWPGLVGLLNLNASLTKAGVPYSTLWSEDFTDDLFLKGLQRWLKTGVVRHKTDHVTPYQAASIPRGLKTRGEEFAREFRTNKAILGVFDEGCMGMYNAIIPDELLHPTGAFKERLSQSALYAKMLTVRDKEAEKVFEWLQEKGMQFRFGRDEATELTKAQVLQQCKMYIAAVRLAKEFGCAAIGIQYQQGLKDLTPPLHRRILSMAIAEPRASASRRCISDLAAEPSRESVSPDLLSGAACLWPKEGSITIRDWLKSWRCRTRKRKSDGSSRPRSGRSCMRC
jgi:hypothetical protein